VDFSRFEALTFDCYGTLIDWETGIIRGLRSVVRDRAVATDDQLLESYARHEAALEAGEYLPYRQVLGSALMAVCGDLGLTASADEIGQFAGSVGDWPAFDDSAPALQRLADRFRLGVITNCDDDLFAASNRRLGVKFDWVITAQQARSYKPSHRNFELAFETMGIPRDRILHVAQSLFHDHVPARELGVSSAWIDRRHDRPGHGATPPAAARPDFTAPDMATFADAALGPRTSTWTSAGGER
jgi:2-haloacid dehalogenase